MCAEHTITQVTHHPDNEVPGSKGSTAAFWLLCHNLQCLKRDVSFVSPQLIPNQINRNNVKQISFVDSHEFQPYLLSTTDSYRTCALVEAEYVSGK